MADALRLFDADNHYYETADAFTRRPRPRHGETIRPVGDARRPTEASRSGDRKPSPRQPDLRSCGQAGKPHCVFPRSERRGNDLKSMFGTLDALSEHPEYTTAKDRLAAMDQQGLESVLLFPTLGVLLQHALRNDVDALHATYHAFNQWLLEDWGFGKDGRLFGVPVIILADPGLAAAEVDWALDAGAKMLCFIPGPFRRGAAAVDHLPRLTLIRSGRASMKPVCLSDSTGRTRFSIATLPNGRSRTPASPCSRRPSA